MSSKCNSVKSVFFLNIVNDLYYLIHCGQSFVSLKGNFISFQVKFYIKIQSILINAVYCYCLLLTVADCFLDDLKYPTAILVEILRYS